MEIACRVKFTLVYSEEAMKFFDLTLNLVEGFIQTDV